jgi:hypothetical protein
MQAAINFILTLILGLFGIVMSFIGLIDSSLTSWMSTEGIDYHLQLVIILVVTVILVMAALRLVGGLLGWLLLILLSLLLLHHVIPEMAQAGWVPGLPAHFF